MTNLPPSKPLVQNFELVVFDWDGTLMNSTATIVQCIQAACADLDLPIPDSVRASQVIGLGLLEALQKAVPSITPEQVPQLVARYRHHYLRQDQQLELFAGSRELLVALKALGVPLAVATGKSRIGLNRVLAATDTRQFFEATRCADETHSKPHPAMLLELCEEFAVSPSKVLMIGDTTHDLQMAENAGAQGVGVSFGAHPAALLQTCAHRVIVDSMAALHAYLCAYSCD